MSAWFVWSAIGLYPGIPGRGELLIGSPLFSLVIISRAGAPAISIEAPAAGTDAPYVQSLTVNGRATSDTWLPESFSASGGTLHFELGTTAHTSWGSGATHAPPSWGQEK
jgi:putative alpha-1,2-mannosidase